MADLLDKNRKRFESIVSDWRFPFLSPIYQRLLAADTSLTDAEITASYLSFSDCIQTNTFAAAELEWVVVSILCWHRPHLTPFLIRRGLLSIVYSLGAEISVAEVIDFIKHHILAANAEPYGGLPPAFGVHWLKEILPTQSALIQQVLGDVIAENNRELGLC